MRTPESGCPPEAGLTRSARARIPPALRDQEAACSTERLPLGLWGPGGAASVCRAAAGPPRFPAVLAASTSRGMCDVLPPPGGHVSYSRKR